MLRDRGLPRLQVEPPGPHLRRRTTPGEVKLTAVDPGAAAEPIRTLSTAPLIADEVSSGAVAGAVALALSSSGEVVLLAVLLGIAAGEVLAGAVAVLATGSVAIRWGTTSLDAIAGAQSVLGPGVAVGPAAAAASTWCAAAALVLAGARGWRAVAFGLTGGLVVAGPAAGSADLVAMRAAAAVAGVGLAVVAGRRAPPVARLAALALAAGAVVLALVA